MPLLPIRPQNASMVWWQMLGVPADKLVMGMATYGRSFRMISSDSQYSLPGASFNGAGDMGDFSATAGFLAYYEVSHSTFLSFYR